MSPLSEAGNHDNRLLREIVVLGGLALQAEDCAIRAAVHQRGELGGLALLENERHRQFIIWRSILPVWHCELEKDGNSDLIVYADGAKHHFEMKNWTGATGERQLSSMRSDVAKLQIRLNGYVLVTSINPPECTTENLEFLLDRVGGLNAAEQKLFAFLTVGRRGEHLEAWIAGWPLDRSARSS